MHINLHLHIHRLFVRGSGYVKNASLNFLLPLKRRFLMREEQFVTRELGAGVHTQTSHWLKE